MIRNFLTEFREIGAKNPTREFPKIANNYMKGFFLFDLLPLIPSVLYATTAPKNIDPRHFYVLKIIRLYQAQTVFNVQKIMQEISLIM